MKFNVISDAGHAWLEVDLRQFPNATQFGTGYGYINGNTIYLEEDVEMPQFLGDLVFSGVAMNEIELTEIEVQDEWHGRNFARNENLLSTNQAPNKIEFGTGKS
jgi:hypothetical protein